MGKEERRHHYAGSDEKEKGKTPLDVERRERERGPFRLL